MLAVEYNHIAEKTIEAWAFMDELDLPFTSFTSVTRCARHFIDADANEDRVLSFGETKKWMNRHGITCTDEVTDECTGRTPG